MTFITSFYQSSNISNYRNTSDRIDYASHYFLGKPYLINPQGEGADGVIDQVPLYRFDGFDCVTYVNNVLALALSHDTVSFEANLLRINYYHGIAIYENRFHFMSCDWNPQNQKNNIVYDVTENIVDENHRAVALFAEGDIDKPSWYLKKSENKDAKRASILRKMASLTKKEFVSLPYLPLSALFDANKNPNLFLFDQIPAISVVEIVRPNWNLKEKIGTNLHVSHVGFSVRAASGELLFRHASSERKCVVEMLLSDYLRNYLDSITIKGIHVQSVKT